MVAKSFGAVMPSLPSEIGKMTYLEISNGMAYFDMKLAFKCFKTSLDGFVILASIQ